MAYFFLEFLNLFEYENIKKVKKFIILNKYYLEMEYFFQPSIADKNLAQKSLTR